MTVLLSDQRAVQTAEDVVAIRQAVRQRAVELGFNLVDQTKIVTAASELARNTLQHGGGGTVTIEAVENLGRRGLRLAQCKSSPLRRKAARRYRVAPPIGSTTPLERFFPCRKERRRRRHLTRDRIEPTRKPSRPICMEFSYHALDRIA